MLEKLATGLALFSVGCMTGAVLSEDSTIESGLFKTGLISMMIGIGVATVGMHKELRDVDRTWRDLDKKFRDCRVP